jgi:hypothetical protein
MLGYKAGNDGIYGLIQGQDLLLILHKKIAELMSRSLLIPKPAAAVAEGAKKGEDGSGKK